MSHQDQPHCWEQQLTAWQASGLSAAAFCREHGLVYHQFIYWRHKLTQAPRLQADASSGFARAVPVLLPKPETDEGLCVSLPGGISISGLHAGNVGLLGTILSQL